MLYKVILFDFVDKIVESDHKNKEYRVVHLEEI